jgi:DNA helicase HerA-like ATPase
LVETEFWNKETLSILFKATANTQAPFINRLINGRERFGGDIDRLENYIRKTFKRTFTSTSPKRETAELLKSIADIIDADDLKSKLSALVWWGGQQNKFCYPQQLQDIFFNGEEHEYNQVFLADVNAISIQGIDAFDELIIRVNLQLVNDLLYGYVQFEHIQPLLKRIESSVVALRRVIEVKRQVEPGSILTVVSLRKCNQEIKKVVPLLLAKHYYEQHKQSVENPADKTLHLIIDEAHNILSEQSMREQESWKDYRLELFEEIIKEGRKFGMFLTLSSQRPADISPTIMSQIHNFFIHRLVNDKDLFLLDNTISTLDGLSKSMIPNLAKGCCIVTGTSFDLPLVMQVDLMATQYQPDSEDVDLAKLWS